MASLSKFKGRTFRVWEFHVSHSRLLLRSHELDDTIVDIVFLGVAWMDVPDVLRGLVIEKGNEEDLHRVVARLGQVPHEEKVFALVAEGRRFLVVGSVPFWREFRGGVEQALSPLFWSRPAADQDSALVGFVAWNGE